MSRRRVLNDSQVIEIKREYKTVKSYQKLADKYGVGASTIRDIILNVTTYSVRL